MDTCGYSGVLDDEDHGQGQGGYHGLEDRFPSSRKSCRDAHDDPCPGRDDDEDRSQGSPELGQGVVPGQLAGMTRLPAILSSYARDGSQETV
jgi:hypothetical protein